MKKSIEIMVGEKAGVFGRLGQGQTVFLEVANDGSGVAAVYLSTAQARRLAKGILEMVGEEGKP